MGKSYRSNSKHDKYKKFDSKKKSTYSNNSEQSDGKKSDWRKESDSQQN
jgi:hypothetical protein